MEEIKYIDRLDEICKFLNKYEITCNNFNNAPYNKETDEEARIVVLNPYNGENLIVDVDWYELTVFFDYYHEHYFSWDGEYERFIHFIIDFFANRICTVSLFYNNGEKLMSTAILTKSEVNDFNLELTFEHIMKIPEFCHKINATGATVKCSFWNPIDNTTFQYSKNQFQHQ